MDSNIQHRVFNSIAELHEEVRHTILCNPRLSRRFSIEGELMDFNVRGANIFFKIKDNNNAQMECFVKAYKYFRINPSDFSKGDQVVLTGNVDIWTTSGKYVFIATAIEQGGEGAFLAKLKALKARLEAEGLFDPAHKKTIPKYPRHIGLITSYDNDAYHDVVDNGHKNNPHIRFVVRDAYMQGRNAVPSIVESIDVLDSMDLDMIVIARGGGGETERWTFNDEAVVRAIYNAKTPIITAIGHTLNANHLADYVADASAVVPTDVAKEYIPKLDRVFDELKQYLHGYQLQLDNKLDNLNLKIDNYMHSIKLYSPKNQIDKRVFELDNIGEKLDGNILFKLERYKGWLEGTYAKLQSKSPASALNEKKLQFQVHEDKLHSIMRLRVQRICDRLINLTTKLDGLSPTAKLINGFGYISTDETPLTSVNDVNIGDKLNITVSDGVVDATIDSIIVKNNLD